MDEQPKPQTNKRWYLAVIGVVLLIGAAISIRPAADKSASAKTDQGSVIAPAAGDPKRDAIVSTEAKLMLDQMRTAYQKLKSAEFTGAVTSNVDADGQQENSETKFVSSFADPARFRHDGERDLAAGSNGE